MIRHARVLPVLLLAPLLLTACGSEKADAGAPSGAASATVVEEIPAETPAEAPGEGELTVRAQAMGVAPELVYVTEAPGFALAEQSVGVLGDDGFSATWVDGDTNALLRLAVDRGSITAGTCPEQPVGDMSGEHTTCERDGDAWYRTGAGRHEYALPEDGHVVRVSAEQDAVPRDVLRAAVLAAHRPDAAETDRLLPSAEPASPTPVERGDLPPFGDGAPDNHVDEGG
ncbi:membrane protein [Streptomyces sp. NRRL WC-3753]|nr:membrane protein [Streptomyces sp. NRRL WC-3753]